jgi:hypothetical protein
MTNAEKDISLLKHYCARLKFEIVKEYKDATQWHLYFKIGETILLVEQQPDCDFCYVFYSLNIQDTKLQEMLDKVDQDPQFMYGLKSALFDPHVGVSFIAENQHLRGYHISRKIFLHGGSPFSIKDFDEAAQAVTMIGLRGLAFINSVIGDNTTTQKIGQELPKSSPDGMFY